jgi:C-terminal processing protease CtpA/Prc
MVPPRRSALAILAAAICAGLTLPPSPAQETYDKNLRERVRQMVRDVADTMRKNYYDPTYHGIDMDARFHAAEETIQNAANLGQAFGAIAQALDALNDSHTFFTPPNRPIRFQLGYVLQMVGDGCFITAVRPGTDAEEKIVPGDQVISWQGFAPTRATLWKLDYSINRLYAASVQQFTVRRPDGSEHKVEVKLKVKQMKRVLDLTSEQDYYQMVREEENDERVNRHRFQEMGNGPMIWKMPEFDLSDDGVERMIKAARRHPALVIDLRGNPGGLVKTLQYLVGSVMDHDVTIATRKGRKADLKPMVAKTRRSSVFTGKLIVLVDSRSASAAELFARVVQLEHRGTVLGDHSSGSVMESLHYPFEQGTNTKIFYGASITEADLLMGDGKSLEHTGVTPDEVILPTAIDLAEGRDPVLARAVELAGGKIDALAAGRLFPVEWQPN